MEEKLSDMEIEKLRAIVGLDSETDLFGDEMPAGEIESIPNTPVSVKPQSPPSPVKTQSSVPASTPKKPEECASVSVDTELFVKVEEHAAIGKKLSEAKGDMKLIADTVSLLAKAEKLKSEAITRMEGALDKIDAEIEDIESKLVAPEGLHVPEMNISSIADSGDFLDLSSKLDSLKNELGGITKK